MNKNDFRILAYQLITGVLLAIALDNILLGLACIAGLTAIEEIVNNGR